MPVCGNGSLEAGERCDDGDTASGDGCDAACVPETPDSCEDAALIELSPGIHTFRGDTTGLADDYVGCGYKAGDAWYRFSVAEPVVFSAETEGAFNSILCFIAATAAVTCSVVRLRRGCWRRRIDRSPDARAWAVCPDCRRKPPV